MNLREQFEKEAGIPAEGELFGKKWDFNDEYVEWLEERCEKPPEE